MLRQFKVGGRRLWIARRWVRFQNGKRICLPGTDGVGVRLCEFADLLGAAIWEGLWTIGFVWCIAVILAIATALLAAGVGVVIAIGGLPLWIWIWLL